MALIVRSATSHMPTSFGLSLLIFFSLAFSWTGWFRNYRFWDILQLFLPFNSRFLDMDGQKLCEKSALVVCMIGLSKLA
jgi:hypothetical protein